MIANSADIRRLIDAVLKERGYHRVRNTWRLKLPEVILVFDLQKSPYGGQFYVNLGVYVRELGDKDTPPEEHCHLRMRLDRLAEDRNDVLRAFDLEDTTQLAEQRQQNLMVYIELGAAWLDGLTRIDTLKRRVEQDENLRCRTVRKLLEYFDLL